MGPLGAEPGLLEKLKMSIAVTAAAVGAILLVAAVGICLMIANLIHYLDPPKERKTDGEA